MLSQSDTHAIQAMRQMLSEWEKMSVRAATTADSHSLAAQWGRFAEACGVANYSLFKVLDIANTYLDDVHAAAALREGR